MLKKFILSIASLILIFLLFSCDGNIKNIEFSFSSPLESEFPQSAFNINDLNFIDQSFSTAGSVIDLRGLFISPDGGKFYALDRVGEIILQYTLESVFMIESAVHEDSFSFANLMGTGCQTESAAHGIHFRADGSRMFVLNRDEIWQYDLPKPWIISTAFLSGYNCLDNIVTRGHGIDFSHDGGLLYVDDRSKGKIYSLLLEEPWDISNLEYLAEYKILRHSEVRGIRITEDGTSVFILDTGLMEIQQHDFSVPSDLYTLKCFSHTSVFGQSINPRGIAFSSHGPYVYISDAGTGIIYQYDFKN